MAKRSADAGNDAVGRDDLGAAERHWGEFCGLYERGKRRLVARKTKDEKIRGARAATKARHEWDGLDARDQRLRARAQYYRAGEFTKHGTYAELRREFGLSTRQISRGLKVKPGNGWAKTVDRCKRTRASVCPPRSLCCVSMPRDTWRRSPEASHDTPAPQAFS